ncbi:MAG: hypothetical protein DRP74_07545 [Candidatus Omnitrophota bacterium]|nr:MAG: hypothetical protein DRP74_07545 [Candidatus Omnitrophota bacterium]
MLRKKTAELLTKYICFVVVLIPFMASFSSSAVVGSSITVIIAFIIKRCLLKDFKFIRTPAQVPFLLLFSLSLLSFFKTVDLRASTEGLWKLFYYGSLFTILTEELKGARHARWIINASLFGMALVSIDGIWQLHWGWDFMRRHVYNVQETLGNFPRLRASFPHTNIFAAYLAVFLPLAMSMLLYYWKKKFIRIIYLSVLILAVFCLFWTFSQGAILGVLVAFIFIAVLRKSRFIFIFLAIFAVLVPFIMPQGVKQLISGADTVWQILLNPNRIGDFRNALNMISHNPFLGVGVNTYCLNIEKYFINDGSIFVGKAGYAHNIYLHMAAEIGIFGVLAFCWLIFRLFKFGLKKYKTQRNLFIKMYILGVLGGILSFLINGLTETVLYYPKVAVLFWFEIGVLFGLSKFNNTPDDNNADSKA